MKYQSKRNIIYLIFCVFGLCGVIFGAIFANEFACGNYINIIGVLKKIGFEIQINRIDQRVELKNFLCQYIVFTVLVWLFGFTALAVYMDNLIVFLRGFVYGYTLSIFFIEFKAIGITVFFINDIVPALIFLPILFRISYVSIKYSINKFNYFSILKETKRYNDMNTYLLELILSIIGLFVVFIIQMYITNPIIQKIGL